MKEFLEIKIVEKGKTHTYKKGDYVCFSQIDNPKKGRFICSIINPKGDVLILSSQLFYDKISFDLIGKDVEVDLYNKSFKWKWFRKKSNYEWIGKGIITKRYFEPTLKPDWQVKDELDEGNSIFISSEIKLSEIEKKFVGLGNTPISMDDGWYYYYENDILHVIYCWTQKEVIRCYFKKADNFWIIDRIQLRNNWLTTNEFKTKLELFIKFRLELMNGIGVKSLNFDEIN